MACHGTSATLIERTSVMRSWSSGRGWVRCPVRRQNRWRPSSRQVRCPGGRQFRRGAEAGMSEPESERRRCLPARAVAMVRARP
jgi:hypothetical protein